jgi:hypothetical protein
MSVIIAVDLTD